MSAGTAFQGPSGPETQKRGLSLPVQHMEVAAGLQICGVCALPVNFSSVGKPPKVHPGYWACCVSSA